MRSVIIDDEENSAKLLVSMLEEYCPEIQVVGLSDSIIDGAKLIKNTKPDIVFLDIEMPQGTGFDLLEIIPETNAEIIFVTAYASYAIDAFKIDALDYILKPIDESELRRVIKKAEMKRNLYSSHLGKTNYSLGHGSFNEIITLPTSDGQLLIKMNNILYIKADSSYSIFYLQDQTSVMISKNLKTIEKIVSGLGLVRIHKSYIINPVYLKRYKPLKNTIEVEMENSQILYVSKSFRDDFLRQLSSVHKL